jgi:hypothetical protein
MQKSCNQFVPIKVKIQIKKVNPGGTFFRFIEKKHQYLQPFLSKKILAIQPWNMQNDGNISLKETVAPCFLARFFVNQLQLGL